MFIRQSRLFLLLLLDLRMPLLDLTQDLSVQSRALSLLSSLALDLGLFTILRTSRQDMYNSPLKCSLVHPPVCRQGVFRILVQDETVSEGCALVRSLFLGDRDVGFFDFAESGKLVRELVFGCDVC
jgi:hypothetical protein